MIYFLRAEQDSESVKAGWIKIGTSIRLSSRLKQIAALIGHMPTVLAVMDGSYAEESALHEKFDHAREWCEWFSPRDDLLALIETECRPWDGESLKVIKADRAVVAKAKYVAEVRGVPLAEYVTDVMRLQVDRDFAKVTLGGEAKP